ncbi:hypothetical protein COCMIDRAFT_6144 [Bipolaris oryzae ATCC 44560]|uniref:Uncharacterized protein n=1 Tax=Bipolaris oryzae ATCC 44560 TaxID=930090 RepID=W6Z3J4_COCMI|nr:uncharacterized protein COCMIDRAFT_6144 [Bipolaris oryzae ATCC 44560]EUC44535.1 hypothetical protein COCMIDRAFT_6144 [Bipolaris oryzae ATCC 44560]
MTEKYFFDPTSPQAPPKDKNATTSSSASMLPTSGKGKLVRVSRVAKQKALQQFGPQSDDKNAYAKTGEKGVSGPDTPIAALLIKRRSHRSEIVPGKKVTNNTRTCKPHIKHKVDDDEDYVPSQIEKKRNKNKNKQSSAKRKADRDTKEDGKQNKKPRLQANNPEGSIDCAEKQRDQSKSFIKPASSAVSSRHSLIAGLKGSQKPIDASQTRFKKPMLPSHITQAPLTPTKPKKKLVETQKRLHTPRDARRPLLDDVFSQMPSSPPIPYEADEMNDWSQDTRAVTAILSSNSKPIPASPNAESTAISGHANCDDVAHEKRAGDSQTAKSDPFTRRTKSGKATSFLRRLTEDGSKVVDLDLSNQCSTLAGDCRNDQQHTSEAEILPVYLDSSPPRVHSPISSHSSTSAEYLFSSEPQLPSSEAEEIGWEKSFEPHQCSLHDVLISTSKRVVRHIVDSETGLDEIAETFATHGEYIQESLLSQHDDDYKHAFADMESKRGALREELEQAIKRMAGERKRIGFDGTLHPPIER